MRKLREHRFVCEYCSKEVVKVNRNKNPGRFCNRSCSNAWQHASGARKNPMNRKTVEEWWEDKLTKSEIEEKRKKRSKKLSASNSRSWDERYGKETSQKMKDEASKTWDERYGKEKAQKMKDESSKKLKGIPLSERMTEQSLDELKKRLRNSPPMKGKKHSKETREKMKKAALKSYKEGRVPDPRSGRGVSGYYKNFLFRSTYEYAFLKSLEARGIELKDVEYESIRIPYLSDKGESKTYVPDFLIFNTLVEVKPKKRLSEKSVKIKIEAARMFCQNNSLEFKVVTEEDLDCQLLKVASLRLDPDVVLLGE